MIYTVLRAYSISLALFLLLSAVRFEDSKLALLALGFLAFGAVRLR